MNYSALAKREEEIEKRISYWSKRGDGVFTARMLPDGFSRTDALAFSMITIDTEVWKEKDALLENDGENGVVNVVHTPNHRGCKGTEFLIHAVEELKSASPSRPPPLLPGGSGEARTPESVRRRIRRTSPPS